MPMNSTVATAIVAVLTAAAAAAAATVATTMLRMEDRITELEWLVERANGAIVQMEDRVGDLEVQIEELTSTGPAGDLRGIR